MAERGPGQTKTSNDPDAGLSRGPLAEHGSVQVRRVTQQAAKKERVRLYTLVPTALYRF